MSRFKHFRSSLATGVAALALAGGVAPAEASVTTSTMSADGAAEAVTLTSTAGATATASRTAATTSSATSTSTSTATATLTASATATKKATTTATSCTLGESTTGVTCDEAIAFMAEQMNSGSTAWHDLCLALVSQSCGSVYAGYPSASSVAYSLQSEGLLHTTTDLDSIPRGAIIWLTNSSGAGHVVISLGEGKAISSDVPNGSIGAESGAVGIVAISFFTDTWGQTLIGWSAPTT